MGVLGLMCKGAYVCQVGVLDCKSDSVTVIACGDVKSLRLGSGAGEDS